MDDATTDFLINDHPGRKHFIEMMNSCENEQLIKLLVDVNKRDTEETYNAVLQYCISIGKTIPTQPSGMLNPRILGKLFSCWYVDNMKKSLGKVTVPKKPSRLLMTLLNDRNADPEELYNEYIRNGIMLPAYMPMAELLGKTKREIGLELQAYWRNMEDKDKETANPSSGGAQPDKHNN